jgi:hypothetical protein
MRIQSHKKRGGEIELRIGSLIAGKRLGEIVDLARTEQRVLERYMGKEGYASFIAHHRPTATKPMPAA